MALVTGGAQGIGRAVAESLLKNEAKVGVYKVNSLLSPVNGRWFWFLYAFYARRLYQPIVVVWSPNQLCCTENRFKYLDILL